MNHIMINYQLNLEQKIIQCPYIDTDAVVLRILSEDIIKDFKNLEDLIDFSNLSENHEIFGNKNKKKLIEKFEKETPKTLWIDEFICLRSKLYSFKCGNDNKNELKGIFKSQSKIINFEEYKKCLDGSD